MICTKLKLLNHTINHATSNSRYYNRIFPKTKANITNFNQLHDYPLLTREQIIKHEFDILIDNCVPDYIRRTGGTSQRTDGTPPLRRFHSDAERRALEAILVNLQLQIGGLKPLGVRITTFEHGPDVCVDLPGTFAMPLERPSHFDAIVSLLKQEIKFPNFTQRVKSLSGPLTAIKPLTLLCLDQNLDPNSFSVDNITVFGWNLSDRWRCIIRGYWNADISEMYGLSEVNGLHAVRCASCGHFHMSELCVVEILGLNNNRPVTAGNGRIVATSLYPLNQIQPIIRYDTGDVIRIIESDCPNAESLTFEFVGRLKDILWVNDANGNSQIVISPIVLNSVLEEIPEISLRPHFRVENLNLQSNFGWKKYKVSWNWVGKQINVMFSIEVNFDPLEDQDRIKKLEQKIRNSLVQAFPIILSLEKNGRMHINFEWMKLGTTNFGYLV